MQQNKKMTSWLDPEDYSRHYYDGQKQQRLFHLPFREFERLAANKLRSDLAANIPQVNDGSLAGIIRETPMRVLAQQMTGDFSVLSALDPTTGEMGEPALWFKELINIIWNNKILPRANKQASPINKMQLSLYKSLIYGSIPIYDFLTYSGTELTSDFVILDPRDVYLEVGKSSDLDSDYIFVDTWYTPLQLKKIISKSEGVETDGGKTTWDITALKKIYASHADQTKDYLQKNQAERNRPVMAQYFKFTTIYQRGLKAPFDTFYIGAGDGGQLGPVQLVRKRFNTDPLGDIPIHYLYAFQDLVNPYGTGQIEISGGTQNVLDYLTQLHVLANQIGLQPPIMVEGDRSMTDLDSMVYSPSQFWFTGTAKVDVMETSNNILAEFPKSYQLYKSQLTNMQQTSTIDIPATAGDPSNGKTPQAIQQNQNREGSHDNYYRKQVAQTYSRVFRHMMNDYLNNMTGDEMMQVAAEDAANLSRLDLIPTDVNGEPDTKQVSIDWDKIHGAVDIKLDPDSSKDAQNKENIQELSSLMTVIQQNPYMIQYINSTGYELNMGQLYVEFLTSLGVKDIEKILRPLSAKEKNQAATVPPMVFDKPKIDLKYPDMPPSAQLQLLQKLGLQVSLADVLAGPVPDQNIRGVFQPEPAPANIRQTTAVPPQQDPATGQPIPQNPPRDYDVLPSKATFQPNPNDQQEVASAVSNVMGEKGVAPNVAAGIVHARAMGLPENEIQAWLEKNGGQNGQQR
jgi:hypothetical protein